MEIENRECWRKLIKPKVDFWKNQYIEKLFARLTKKENDNTNYCIRKGRERVCTKDFHGCQKRIIRNTINIPGASQFLSSSLRGQDGVEGGGELGFSSPRGKYRV